VRDDFRGNCRDDLDTLPFLYSLYVISFMRGGAFNLIMLNYVCYHI